MHTFNFKPKRVIKYPELCPVCGGANNLKTLPIGPSLEGKNDLKTYVHIHLNCWRAVENRNLFMLITLLLASFGTVGILVWLGYSRYVGYAASLPVALTLYYLYPKSIEILNMENEIELKFSNKKYAVAFSRANSNENNA